MTAPTPTRPDGLWADDLTVGQTFTSGTVELTAQDIVDCFAAARAAGHTNINMDLIAGLPGENLQMFEETLAWLRSLAPESMTVHTLSIKRSSLLHLWEAQLPDGEMVADMVRAGARTAHEMGMQPYYLYRQKYMAGNQENVGYALPGHACAPPA